MKEKFVIAYYGKCYTDVFTHHGWRSQFIGNGIVAQSKPLDFYPTIDEVEANKPEIEFDYAKIEKRFYLIS